jgi:hypothetical protein
MLPVLTFWAVVWHDIKSSVCLQVHMVLQARRPTSLSLSLWKTLNFVLRYVVDKHLTLRADILNNLVLVHVRLTSFIPLKCTPVDESTWNLIGIRKVLEFKQYLSLKYGHNQNTLKGV